MIKVLDNVLSDPMTYLSEVRGLTFSKFLSFNGIAFSHRRDVDEIAESETNATSVLSFFRRSPAGQAEPNYIHSDEAMGRFTAIYYMNPEPPQGDGTAFWNDATRPYYLVESKFNRLLLFDSKLRHSRALFDNYGEGDGARLIQVIFLR